MNLKDEVERLTLLCDNLRHKLATMENARDGAIRQRDNATYEITRLSSETFELREQIHTLRQRVSDLQARPHVRLMPQYLFTEKSSGVFEAARDEFAAWERERAQRMLRNSIARDGFSRVVCAPKGNSRPVEVDTYIAQAEARDVIRE